MSISGDLVDSAMLKRKQRKRQHLRSLLAGAFQRVEASLPRGAVPMLTDQYRIHPAICEVVSDSFYDGELLTPRDVSICRTKVDHVGLWLVPSMSIEESPPRSTSEINPNEADRLVEIMNTRLYQKRALW